MPNQRRRVAAVAILLLAMTLVAATLYRGFVVIPYDLRIIRQDIPGAGLAHGPIRVLLLSDVDFPSYQSNLDRAAEAARAFDPDLVLVAGDFLDRGSALTDPAVRRAAQAWFEGLPAPGRRLLAPGEAESPALEALRTSWPRDVIEPVANEARRFEIRGERLDVFVADDKTDPAPWRVSRDDSRWTASANCRGTETYFQLARPDSREWGEFEVTLALRPERSNTDIMVRLAAGPQANPLGGKALVVVRDTAYPGFHLRADGQRDHELSGRWRSTFVPPTGSWTLCRMRVSDQANSTRVQARFWTEGSDEPSDWAIDASATNRDGPRTGTIALGGKRGHLRFADLVVTDASGNPLFRDAFDDQARFRADWRQWSRLGAWLASSPDGAMRLLLAHTPDVALDVAALEGFPPAAILAGHTHGGQVDIPLLGPVYTATHLGRSFDRGLFRFAGTPLFITAGVGTSVIPFRLGVPPDVALLTFHPGVSSGP